MEYKTEQETFWNGEFGDAYVSRNTGSGLLEGKIALWKEVIGKMENIESVIEFGSNIGLNLKAMKTILPNLECSAIEINHKAASILKEDTFFKNGVHVFEQSILEYEPKKQYDFVFTAGVLIHINPDELDKVYEKLYLSSKRYICIDEYYNPAPVTVEYRGNKERLFKRDFAGEFMDKFPDVKMVDYGFVYHRDRKYTQDDENWFLLEKTVN